MICLNFSLLQKIKDYIVSESQVPFVIHGQSGCGKTSIMAAATRDVGKWLE
jgi:fructose/tagatose bisphosphate aldolase